MSLIKCSSLVPQPAQHFLIRLAKNLCKFLVVSTVECTRLQLEQRHNVETEFLQEYFAKKVLKFRVFLLV